MGEVKWVEAPESKCVLSVVVTALRRESGEGPSEASKKLQGKAAGGGTSFSQSNWEIDSKKSSGGGE